MRLGWAWQISEGWSGALKEAQTQNPKRICNQEWPWLLPLILRAKSTFLCCKPTAIVKWWSYSILTLLRTWTLRTRNGDWILSLWWTMLLIIHQKRWWHFMKDRSYQLSLLVLILIQHHRWSCYFLILKGQILILKIYPQENRKFLNFFFCCHYFLNLF